MPVLSPESSTNSREKDSRPPSRVEKGRKGTGAASGLPRSLWGPGGGGNDNRALEGGASRPAPGGIYPYGPTNPYQQRPSMFVTDREDQ